MQRLERRIELLIRNGDKRKALAAHKRLLEVATASKPAAVWSAQDAGTILKQILSRSKEHRARCFGVFRSALSRNYKDLFTTGPRSDMIRELRSFVQIAAEIDAVNFADCERDLRRVVEWLEKASAANSAVRINK